tara:strand:+ start:2037 stop:2507 length:471 start_codon:yes stop_codon:yes gene_type:complete
MNIEFLFLIILSIAMILSIPKFNNKLPIGFQNITEKKTYLLGIFICVIILSMFNIQYLVYFSVLFIMIKVCFVNKNEVTLPDIKNAIPDIKNAIPDIKNALKNINTNDNIKENFGIPVDRNKKIYYDDKICIKLDHSTEDAQKIVNDYNNDYYSPK